MIKKIIILFVCIGFAVPAQSQTEDELKALAMAQARITSNATVAEDYSTVLDYTLPAVLELMGGKQAALAGVETAMADIKSEGFSITSSEVTKIVGFAFESNEYRAILENHIVLNMGNGTSIDSTSYIFGFYNQEAAQWYFIEAAEFKSPILMEQVLPGFETQLVIPDDVRKVIQN